MRRFVIGTAGHVDHGKTALVRALTGVDTDRLPEERRRGISIELGFAPLDLGDGCTGSVVDVPGHRRLVRAMIAGAAGMQLVLLVIAADEGVMPQTREHVAACALLGLDRCVVVVTKADVVDAGRAAAVAQEARALLGPAWWTDCVVCSARTDEGIDAARAAIRRAVQALPPRVQAGAARLGVDRVFTVRGAGTVVTGTLVAGRIAAGDPVYLVAERGVRQSVARGLHVHDASVTSVEAPARLAVNLGGVDLAQVRRGDVVTTDAALRSTAAIDVLLSAGYAVARGATVVVHVGAAAAPARVDALDATAHGTLARLRLARAVPIAGGDRIVVRSGVEGPDGAIVGGGVVLDAHPGVRAARAERRTVTAALASRDADVALRALVDAAAPKPVALGAYASRLVVGAAALEEAAARAAALGVLVRVGDGWTARATLDTLAARARELVRRHRTASPHDRGMPIETLRAEIARTAGAVAAQAAIDQAARADSADRIVLDGDVARGAEVVRDTEADARAAAVRAAVEQAGPAGVTEASLAVRVPSAPAAVRRALARLVREDAAVRLGDLWFSRAVVDEVRRRVTEHFAGARTLRVVELKAIAGIARRQAVLLLEHFDRLGLTRREGDARVAR